MAFTIRRGSTPRITARVKDDIDLTPIKSVWLTVTQGITDKQIVIDKVTSDLTINGKIVSVMLTQEETLSLTASVQTYTQIRLLDDSDIAYVSQRVYTVVEDVDKEGEIT